MNDLWEWDPEVVGTESVLNTVLIGWDRREWHTTDKIHVRCVGRIHRVTDLNKTYQFTRVEFVLYTKDPETGEWSLSDCLDRVLSFDETTTLVYNLRRAMLWLEEEKAFDLCEFDLSETNLSPVTVRMRPCVGVVPSNLP